MVAVNYLAVLGAAVAGIIINALWYTTIFKGAVTALRGADKTIAGRDPAPPMYAVALIGQFVMAYILAVMLKMTGMSGWAGGLQLGAMLWLGFTIPPMAQVQTFGYRQVGFVLVDGSVWLVAALAMGAILGMWG